MAFSLAGHLAPLIKEGPACSSASVCLALLTAVKTIHDRLCRVLNRERKKFEDETRLLCGLFEKVAEVLQGSFDGRHRLRPEVSQLYSRMDRVPALRIVILGLPEEKAFLRRGWIGTSSGGGGGEWNRPDRDVPACGFFR